MKGHRNLHIGTLTQCAVYSYSVFLALQQLDPTVVIYHGNACAFGAVLAQVPVMDHAVVNFHHPFKGHSASVVRHKNMNVHIAPVNLNIYEAALDLGATPMQALRKVIVPEIRPGMISGFMLALTLSIDDFAVTVFTIGNEGLETLSTYIYADARKGGLTPELRPLSTIIFVMVLALLIVINRRAGKEKK